MQAGSRNECKTIERGQSVTDRSYRVVDPFHIERDERTHLKPTFTGNEIHTSKYTLLNFFPLCLLQEFRRSANLYFLVIAILQSIKLISPLTPFTAIAPLVMVVSVSLLREAMEDRAKRTSDHMINGKPVLVIRNFEEIETNWASIQVGDIIQILEREMIPADGVILSSNEEDGSCFIDTSNLDGEANLKSREALRVTRSLSFEPSARDHDKYFVKCEQPNQDLYRFSGNLSINQARYSLSEKQFLLRGATLMNTKWIHFLVVYTGHESKIMKNARAPHHKLSHVEIMTSRMVVVLFTIQVLLCAAAVIVHASAFHEHNSSTLWYLNAVDTGGSYDDILLFLTFVVLMNTLIPISLVVTVEMIKVIHARFISWDNYMRNAAGDGAIANTSSLTDELGQVKYIFTDKTGTLTQNQMEFRRCSVGGVIYASAEKKPPMHLSHPHAVSISSLDASVYEDPQVLGGPAWVSCFKGFLRDLQRKESRFAIAMAVCHTVVCETDPVLNDIAYNSDSPDECALVRGAADMGLKLLARNGQSLYLSLTEEGREKAIVKTVTYTLAYEVLRVLHFSSDRKRMSIIVRDPEGRIRMFCKGADSVILERCCDFLSPRSETLEHVAEFANEGLRILLFAERFLEEDYYARWEARYHDAELDMGAKSEKTERLIDELECKFTLLGATAVEDKLQEGVPETISLLQKAGIKIWVLTGDKLETSLEMGKLCRVVTPGMKECVIEATNAERMTSILETALKDTKDNQVVVIEGTSLTWALTPTNRARFLELTLRSATVIVCRTSPLQKAQVVEMVKTGVPYVTLAIGDGANDVSMIRSAHVGVGVMGQEGMQAVRSADYAIQQFSHLGRLLLHHGRLSYMRTAQCINYFFYKNIVFTLPQFIYGTASAYSGQTYFCDLYVTAYNVIFTALPVMVRGILETDLPDKIARRFPELYRSGVANTYFSFSTLTKASSLAAFHAMVVTVIPKLLFQSGHTMAPDGTAGGLWSGGVASFFFIVPIVHLQISFETWNWSTLTKTAYTFSIVVFIVGVAVYDRFDSVIYGVWRSVLSTPLFWLTFVLVVVLCVFPWLAWTVYEENFMVTNPVHILRRARFTNKIADSSSATPRATERSTRARSIRDPPDHSRAHSIREPSGTPHVR